LGMERETSSRELDDVTDEYMIANLRDGDTSACRRLYDVYKPLIVSRCAAILDDPHDVDDAVQEALIKIYRFANTYDSRRSGSDIRRWISKIACREAIAISMRLQHRRRFENVSEYELIPERRPESSKTREIYDEVALKMMALPERLRQSISLYYERGLSQTEIARCCRCDQSTVSDRLRQGINRLRREFERP
jgi:RNA polymerase sigma-70 factor (ECF subfamily)